MSSDASIVNFLLLPPPPSVLRRVFRLRLGAFLSITFVGLTPIAKFGFFFFLPLLLLFFIHQPLSRDLPQSTSFSLPKVSFNYITCCSCQATRGYKTYASQGCACGAITSTKSITRHDRAFGKSSRTRNWFRVSGMKLTVPTSDRTSRLFAVSFYRDEERAPESNLISFAHELK